MRVREAPRPLLERLPLLRDAPGFLPYATLPTPVQRLPELGEGAWIKRDDLTDGIFGGNKVRKLEWVLGAARKAGIEHIVTLGATGTNAGTAVAIACSRLGMRCTVIVFSQPDSAVVRANRLRMEAAGARVVNLRRMEAAYLAFLLHPGRLADATLFLPAGLSSPPAVLGFVNAALELAEQIESHKCPLPERIVVAVGSTSTVAGLALGVTLAGLATEVVGVRVAPDVVARREVATIGEIERLMLAGRELLAEADPSLADMPIVLPELVETRYGSGYGQPTPEGLIAAEKFKSVDGPPLEQTYTAKAAAEFLARLGDSGGEPVLFWNTFASSALEPRSSTDVRQWARERKRKTDQRRWRSG